MHIHATPLCQRALLVGWKGKEPVGGKEGREPYNTGMIPGPSVGWMENSGCICSRPLPGRSDRALGLQLVLPELPVWWQFSEAWDRLQARGRDGDGVLPPRQSTQGWSRVGHGVHALSQAGLGWEPPLLQLLIESIVCRGHCKREQGPGEPARSGRRGPGGLPDDGGIRHLAGSALEGRRAVRECWFRQPPGASSWGPLPV